MPILAFSTTPGNDGAGLHVVESLLRNWLLSPMSLYNRLRKGAVRQVLQDRIRYLGESTLARERHS
jgi:hypothetical protein